jgi:hypothetical protein
MRKTGARLTVQGALQTTTRCANTQLFAGRCQQEKEPKAAG